MAGGGSRPGYARQPAGKRAAKRDNARATSSRPDGLPFGQWLGDIPDLTDAERALIHACARGEWCVLGTEVPTEANDANRIRAEVIRFLTLGGDAAHPVHHAGVQLSGGWIEGELDLDGVRSEGRLGLVRCRLEWLLAFDSAFRGLMLRGSHIGSFSADRCEIAGTLFLDKEFRATGEVRLPGAKIGGDFHCGGGSFRTAEGEGIPLGNALSLDGADIGGSVSLNNGFKAKGEVRLLGARIGGSLECGGGSFLNADAEGEPRGDVLSLDRAEIEGSVFLNAGFEAKGEVRLLGARIGGNLDCSGGSFRNADAKGVPLGDALSADGANIKGCVFFRAGFESTGNVRLHGAKIGALLDCSGGSFCNAAPEGSPLGNALSTDSATVSGILFIRGASFRGAVTLATARVATIADDTECWPDGNLVLDGLQYDRIVGPTDADARIAWLKRQIPTHLGKDFMPQPWEHAIKVLREMGHPFEARRIAIEKQRVWRRAWQRGMWNWPGVLNNLPRWILHKAYGLLAGYGYRPMWAVYWMVAACLACSIVYYDARNAGLFGPSDAIIQTDPRLSNCGADVRAGEARWTDAACKLPPEYPTFHPLLYSVDVILPLVDLHQEQDWGPILTDGKAGLRPANFVRWLVWAEIIFGWAASLLLVAVLGRLVEKD